MSTIENGCEAMPPLSADSFRAGASVIGRQDEERLLRSESRLREAEQLALLGHWEWDPVEDTCVWSAGHFHVFGRDPADACIIRWAELCEMIVPEDRQRVVDLVSASTRAGTPFSYQARFRLPDGSLRVIESRAKPEHRPDGSLRRMLGTVQDVTDRVAAVEAMLASDARFRDSFHRATVAKSLVDLDGRYVEVNAAMCALLGYADSELRGRHVEDFTHAEDRPHARQLIAELLAGETSKQWEKRYVRRDGAVVWALVSVALVRSPDGSPLHFIGEVQDITARKQAQALLQDREAHLQALLASLDDAVLELDAEGTYVNVWAADEVVLARPRSELVGRRIPEVLGEKAAAPFLALIRRVLASGVPESCDYSLEVIGGSRSFLARVAPVAAADGPARTVCMLPRDITDLKMAEAAIVRANAELATALDDLRRAQEQTIRRERLHALGEMASGIAHDFNNSLCSVLGFSELLLADPRILDDREKTRSYVELIRAGAADAASVVRRLREFYRPAGECDERRRLDLPHIVATAVSLTRPRWCNQALASGRIIKVLDELVPIADVWGDEAAVRESMTNLILNAVDAMSGDGTVCVRTRRDGEWAVLEVADDGPGMSAEVRRRCLEPFFTTKGEEGSGLGLSMVYGMVQRHGGQLDLRSAPGAGTTVTLRLPIGSPARDAAPEQEVPPPSPRQVLVVDDETAVRQVVTRILTLDGHHAQSVSTGAEALEILAEQPFELLIVDRAMPGMTGDELAAQVASRHPELGVMMLSGFGDLMLGAGERPSGVDVVVGKPISVAALREAVARALATRDDRRPVAAASNAETGV